MPYLMGGFPTLEASRAVAEAYVAGGADLVELGVPFSDPLADGPVIHVSGVVERARASTDLPVAVGFGIGTPQRAAEAAAAGADGVIVGSRLVRAASEGEDVEALVRGFAAALGG